MVCNSYLTGALTKLFWMGHYFLLNWPVAVMPRVAGEKGREE